MVRPTRRQWVLCIVWEAWYGALTALFTLWALLTALGGALLWAIGLALVRGATALRVLLIVLPAALVQTAARTAVEAARLVGPHYRAYRRRVAALRAWCRPRRAVRWGVEEYARQKLRARPGQPLTDQERVLVRQEKWAKDPVVWQQLTALCRAHPDLAAAARKLRPSPTDNTPLKPDTTRRMRKLWMAAWTYRERLADEAAVPIELTADEQQARKQKVHRLVKGWAIGLGVSVVWFTLFRSYPGLTLVGTAGWLVFVVCAYLYFRVVPPAPQPDAAPTPKEKKDEPSRRARV